ncbi:MAG: efflux RND transporter permease subunit [Myxococcota bacterium]
MLSSIARASVNHRWLVMGATFLALTFGLFAAWRLQWDALPDITGNQVIVLTRAPGRSPLEVEQQVTRQVERAVTSVPGLADTRSISRFGISSVTLIFDEHVDVATARQFVLEALSGLSEQLPRGVEPPRLGPLTGGLGEIFQFTLESDSRSLSELLELARFDVTPILGAIPGIVEVNTWGGQVRTLDVMGDPVRLARRHLTLSDLQESLSDMVRVAPGGALRTDGSGQVYLRASVQPTSREALGDLVVRPRQGDESPVRISDVADVAFGHQLRTGAASTNAEGEVVYVMLQMLRGANALRVTERIHEKLPEVRGLLPPDVSLRVAYDRSELVRATIETISENLLLGGSLVVLVLFLFLGSFRAGLLTAVMIPLSMLGALAGMAVVGVPGNLMSLGAVDFGLLVDGAVVEVESFFEQQDEQSSWSQRIATKAMEVAGPIATSMAIVIVVFLPIFLLSGVDGRLFRPMAAAVVMALVTALVVGATFIPAASALFLRPRDLPRREPLIPRWIRKAYRPVLAFCLERSMLVTLGGFSLLVVGGWFFLTSERSFLPQLDEGDLVIQTTRDSNISIEGAVHAATRLEAALMPLPEVRHVFSRIGSPAVATDIMGLEQSDVFVRLAPKDSWRPGLTKGRLIREMRERIEVLDPNAQPVFTQPIQMRFNELLGGDIADVSANVYGPDLKTLRRLAEQVAERLRNIPGATDVRIGSPPEVPVMDVVPDWIMAGQLGFRAEDVLRVVEARRQGLEVGSTYDGRVPVPVRLRSGESESAMELSSHLVASRNGELVPFRRLAEINHVMTPSLIQHHRGLRRLQVGFNVRDRGLAAVVDDARTRLSDLALPSGYRIVWGGQFETLEQAKRRLAVVIPIALALVAGLLLLLFKEIRLVVFVLFQVPIAAVGGIILLGLSGLPLTISAAIGFLVLSGIAVLNGVVLWVRVQHLERTTRLGPFAIAQQAAENRLRPVLMTALTDMIGFMPMMLSTGIGAEVQRPLATVVVGGLTTSTLLTLFISPSLYVLIMGRARVRAAGEAMDSERKCR